MKFRINRNHLHRFFQVLLIIVVLYTISIQGFAQEPPPRPVQVTVVQNLGFGAFSHGIAGGTITVTATGSRSATGTVIPLSLGFSFSAAVFRLVANPGTLITILNGPPATLPGSNGGSLTLTTGATDPVSPFVITTTPPVYTPMSIGGTLTVGNSAANPPGSYSGTFDITFIQE